MLVLAGEVNNLCDFCFGYFVGIDTTNAYSLSVNMQHDLSRFFAVFAEKSLQNMDDELHRRVVVVEQQNLVHRRLLGFRAGLGDDAGRWPTRFVVTGIARTGALRREGRRRGAPRMSGFEKCRRGVAVEQGFYPASNRRPSRPWRANAIGLEPGAGPKGVAVNGRNCHHHCLSGHTKMLPYNAS